MDENRIAEGENLLGDLTGANLIKVNLAKAHSCKAKEGLT